MNKKFISFVVLGFALLFIANVNALEMNAYSGGWNTTSMEVLENGTTAFYTPTSSFVNRVFFYYDSGMLRITVNAPEVVGDYNVSIKAKRLYNLGNETNQNYTTYTIDIATLLLHVTEEPEPIINQTNVTECEISISVIGRAFYGKNLLVHTTDEKNKDIITKVVGQDGAGNSLICQTNNPFTGFCNLGIPRDSQVDIILLASKEGCTTGQYIITELEGQRLAPEEELETKKTLSIQNIQPESLYDSIVNFTVISQEDGAIIDQATVTIYDPDGSYVTTKSDASGLARYFFGKLGNYLIYATKTGFNPSQNYTTVSRSPRKELVVLIYPSGQITQTNEIYVGDEYDIILYSNGVKINDTLDGSLNFNTRSQAIKFISGQARYVFQQGDVGGLTISIPQSDNYLEAIKDSVVKTGFDFNSLVIWVVIIFVVFIVLVIITRIARRGGGGSAMYGSPPGMETRVG